MLLTSYFQQSVFHLKKSVGANKQRFFFIKFDVKEKLK